MNSLFVTSKDNWKPFWKVMYYEKLDFAFIKELQLLLCNALTSSKFSGVIT